MLPAAAFSEFCSFLCFKWHHLILHLRSPKGMRLQWIFVPLTFNIATSNTEWTKQRWSYRKTTRPTRSYKSHDFLLPPKVSFCFKTRSDLKWHVNCSITGTVQAYQPPPKICSDRLLTQHRATCWSVKLCTQALLEDSQNIKSNAMGLKTHCWSLISEETLPRLPS